MKRIVHRDLKPENILMADENDDFTQVKITGFDQAKRLTDSKYMIGRVGTSYYMAPEVSEGPYSYKCDIWSIGVIAFMLIGGKAPFYGNNDN
jgi:serine/threonine protein kinase